MSGVAHEDYHWNTEHKDPTWSRRAENINQLISKPS